MNPGNSSVVKKTFKLCVGGLLGLIIGVSLRLWFPVSDAAWLGGVPVTAPRGSYSTLAVAPPHPRLQQLPVWRKPGPFRASRFKKMQIMAVFL
jgi:hypothetical protein